MCFCCIYFRLFLLQPNNMCEREPGPSNTTYGGLHLYKKLLCEISRKAWKLRIPFSSRIFAEIQIHLPRGLVPQNRGKEGIEGAANPRRTGLAAGRTAMTFSLPLPGPSQALCAIKSLSDALRNNHNFLAVDWHKLLWTIIKPANSHFCQHRQ